MPFWKRRPKRLVSQPERKQRGIVFGIVSDVGRVRSSNQDRVFALLTSLPSPSGQLPLGLFVVADGMGGHTGGATASVRAIETVTGYVLQNLLLPVIRGDTPEAIRDIMRMATLEANRRIRQQALQEGNDMGTTLTASLVLGTRCYVAHVGDCRLYTYGPAGLESQTRDHSMVARLQELGQITAEEARHHPKRNYLYQSVGQQEEIEVDDPSLPLDDCSHLLLCSDGLWGSVEEKDMAQALAEGGDPQEICERLLAQANAAGGEDNISVIVVALPQTASQPNR